MKRWVAAGALAVWLTAIGAASVSAHAGFISSDPADGASLGTSPRAISIAFTETPDLGLSRIDLVDVGGAGVALGPLQAAPPHGVAAPVLATLADGVYTVTWRVVSTEDGHVTAGAFAFAVGDATVPAGAATQETVTRPTPGSIAAKVALYAGIALLIACALVGLGAFGGRPARLHVVAVLGGVLGFAGAAGILVVERRAVGVPMADLLASPTGRPYLFLVIAALLAAATAVVAAARTPWRNLVWIAGGAAALMAFVRASSGHAAAVTPALPQELLQWVHILAVSAWTGGLVLLVMLLRDPGPTPVAEIRRYSNMALVAVVAVVLTGLARSITQVGGPSAVLDALGTGYGVVLAIKVALAAALIGLGAVNRRRVIPRLAEAGTGPLRAIARAEIAVAVGIAILTATLTGLDPGAAAAAPPPASVLGVAEGTDFAMTTHVRLTATPGTPGANAFEVLLTDPITNEPLDADAVSLRFASASVPGLPTVQIDLDRDQEGWHGQGVAISAAGTWVVTARVLTGADTVDVAMNLITRSDATGQPRAGSPVVTSSSPSGLSVQLSLEDAEGSAAFVHVTALAPDGTEVAVDEVTVVATRADDRPLRLEPEVVSAGHAIAQADLAAGAWSIDAVVHTADGRTLQATLIDVPLGG